MKVTPETKIKEIESFTMIDNVYEFDYDKAEIGVNGLRIPLKKKPEFEPDYMREDGKKKFKISKPVSIQSKVYSCILGVDNVNCINEALLLREVSMRNKKLKDDIERLEFDNLLKNLELAKKKIDIYKQSHNIK